MFSQAKWLLPLKKRLQKFVFNHQLPHALLIDGNQGIGIEPMVENFAKQLLCVHPKNESSCQQCEACVLFESKHHPDYFYCSEPPSVEVIRSIGEHLARTPHFHRRVIVLTAVEALNVTAANALLKNLEEPSPNTVFILLAYKNTVLPAIFSRCLVTVVRPANEHLVEWLQAKYPQYDASQLAFALNISNKNIIQACQILDEKELDERQSTIERLLFSANPSSSWSDDLQQYISSNPDETLYLIYYKVSEYIQKTMLSVTRNINNKVLPTLKPSIDCDAALPSLFHYQDRLIETMRTFQLAGINKVLLLQSVIYHWRTKLYPKLSCSEG